MYHGFIPCISSMSFRTCSHSSLGEPFVMLTPGDATRSRSEAWFSDPKAQSCRTSSRGGSGLRVSYSGSYGCPRQPQSRQMKRVFPDGVEIEAILVPLQVAHLSVDFGSSFSFSSMGASA